jgi:aspartyl-tRNA(Asn)/glutamyl-tRNA(Gln) amidotransferase subunit A
VTTLQKTCQLALASISELQAGFRAKTFKPSEVLAAVLDRAENHDALNIFLTLDRDRATLAAQRADAQFQKEPSGQHPPLLGIPITVKDLLWTKGLRTTRGSLLKQDWIPTEDSPAVARIRAAGSVVVGKTNTSESGWKGDSGNRLIGPTVNPWNNGYSAGGSSGGAAAAVALGIGPGALGTDGGGSVRIPAAFCGVVGLKPSYGRIPYWPPSPEGLSHIGPLARTVGDAAILAHIMMGPDPRDPVSFVAPQHVSTNPIADHRSMRIRLVTSLGFWTATPEAAQATRNAAQLLSAAGHSVTEADLDLPDPFPIMDALWAGHESASYGDDFDTISRMLDPGYAALIRRGRQLGAYRLAQAHNARAHLREKLRQELEPYDVLLTPTTPSAFPLGNCAPPGPDGREIPGLSWTPFTYLFNLTGQPAISVPAELNSAGLPLGVQFVGKYLADDDIVEIARQYELLRRWQPDYANLHIDNLKTQYPQRKAAR